ncbi:MAG: cytochrome c oxidase accessory protein CcoG [Candidatus Lambdaproteobacteria bacterium]|nr:cytochrome c oxidase accessory protein CcoG [Candidatus Lambdaproteobacteria bacterium]
MTTPPAALTTIDATGRRKWVYPAAIHGQFMRWRKGIGYFVIAVFFVMPWIKIGGMQSILIEIPQRRFTIFGHLFWPQDVFYLVFLLVGLAMALFFFTALAGRVWCGWLCPQTVFMEEVFRKIEEWMEGGHLTRRRLDAAPWTLGKVARKVLKHALFLLFSALVSNTFLAYFVGTETLLTWMTRSPADHWTAFLFMVAILAAFYFDFAWFREQFCVVLCPYARFQAVLTDSHTIQVGYDLVRGEPRGKVGEAPGDCINCFKCVAVCPTGIDIRDGYQLECIGCARCIDACDEIMESVQRPKGLVRYDSLARLQGEKTAYLRPRVLIYSVLLVALVVAFFWGVGTRPLVALTVIRPPGDPYALLPDGRISNHFSLMLFNKAPDRRQFRINLDGPLSADLVTAANPVFLEGGEHRRIDVFVNVPRPEVNGGRAPIHFKITRIIQEEVPLTDYEATFLAPGP